MVNNIKIFSKKKNLISRNRASIKYKKYDYLFDEVNGRLFERLKLIKRNFKETLEIGSRTGNTIELFNKKNDMKKIFISDISKKTMSNRKITVLPHKLGPVISKREIQKNNLISTKNSKNKMGFATQNLPN